MAYIGLKPTAGENNSFRILDTLSSFTATFDGSSASIVSLAADTISIPEHRFLTGQRVTYNDGGGTAITGLADGVYYVIKVDRNLVQLASSLSNANNGTQINLTGLGAGISHTLNVAFDGVNTKFKITHDSGTHAKVTRASQVVLSINGVLQQPHDSASPSTGFGIDADSVLVFSTAPASTDTVFGSIMASNASSFEISDNAIDNFTGDNSTVNFTLSKTPPDPRNILVTLDGVVQYPSDSGTTRAYTVATNSNVLSFVSAPATGVAIQVRHIGFAGGVGGSSENFVTSVFGRTGDVDLTSSDDITVRNITAVGATFTGVLTYEDVTNVDSLGIVTARIGVNVPAGEVAVGNNIQLGNAGVATATLFSGPSQIGIQSGGVQIGAGITQLNFIGVGNTFAVNGTTVDVSIQGGGAGAGGTWTTYTAGIATTKSVGVNTNNLDDNDLVGVGNSFQGLYISNGMMITDNTLSGNHYIGTAFNGLMAGPVNIEGTLTVDGNYVVV